MAAGLDPDKAIDMRIKDDFTPSLYNNPELVERVTGALRKEFDAKALHTATPSMGGEDFARYGRTADKIPVMLLWLGAVSQEKFDASQKPGGKPLPALHSSEFAPDPDPTIAAGVKAMTAAAKELLK
jgi:hippurate hydrolase